MATTCLDAIINVFLLENDGVTEETSGYIQRQKGRIISSLEDLDAKLANRKAGALNSAEIRVACLVDWALFRKRISVDGLDNLKALVAAANTEESFKATAIPSA